MYRLQSKVILVTTACLIIIPTVFFFLNDFSGMPLTERICSSLFQAITPRTAGFNSVDLSKMSDSGIGILILLMLIGGSPGSTAGGIKTTTLAVLFINAIAVFKKRSNAGCFGRNIPDTAVKNAATVSFLYVVFSLVGAIAISTMEHLPLAKCIFETVSAIATVGLTLGLTPGLHIPSQLILVFLMFFGRVGGLTIIYAAFSSRNPESSKYPIEDIIVG
jgi:trk system potassium uptake protein TrkH